MADLLAALQDFATGSRLFEAAIAFARATSCRIRSDSSKRPQPTCSASKASCS